MKPIYTSFLMAAGLLAATATYAATAPVAPPSDAPAGTTGLCKDGTYSSNATKKGACSGHKGVKTWYAGSASSSSTAAAPASTPAAAPAAPATPAPAKTTKSASKPAPSAQAAPGGGPGLVWVNTKSNVYHCSGDEWYGKTEAGKYVSEADAKAMGAHASHGKACS